MPRHGVVWIFAVVFAVCLSSARADLAAELQRAEELFRAGRITEARNAATAVLQAQLRDDKADTVESIAATRLQLRIDIEKDPAASTRTLRRLLEKSQRILGDHEETDRVRITLARAISADPDANDVTLEEARTLWRSSLGRLEARGAGRSREAADCLEGLGWTLQGGWDWSFQFDGDPSQPLRPQVVVKAIMTTDTLTGIQHVRSAIQIHQSIGGAQDPEANRITGDMAEAKRSYDAAQWDAEVRAMNQILSGLYDEAVESRREELALWRRENPQPSVVICTGTDAYAYHLPTCYHAQNCREPQTTTADVAARDRTRCMNCDPPSPVFPPAEMFKFRLDGFEYDLRSNRPVHRWPQAGGG